MNNAENLISNAQNTSFASFIWMHVINSSPICNIPHILLLVNETEYFVMRSLAFVNLWISHVEFNVSNEIITLTFSHLCHTNNIFSISIIRNSVSIHFCYYTVASITWMTIPRRVMKKKINAVSLMENTQVSDIIICSVLGRRTAWA